MSYNQPGPYGGQQQPQQPGPYGQQPPQGPYGQQPQAPQPGYGYPQQGPPGVPPQQPNPYGQQPQQQPGPYGQQPGGYSQPQQPGPYGQQPQAPYGQYPPAPPAGGGKKKTGLIIAAVAVVAALGVGAYFVFGGGGASVADDGPHKLTTPATVLDGQYKKADNNSSSSGFDEKDLNDAKKWGVTDPKDVSASYSSGTGLQAKSIGFSGVYGSIDDPEKAVDAMFDKIKTESQKDQSDDDTKGELVGSPEEFNPDGFENGIMKCQEVKITNNDSSASSDVPKTLSMPFCIWGDHSTLAYVISTDVAQLATGKGSSLDDAAANTAKLRNDVRVKI